MSRDTGLAVRLRAKGLNVVEVAGWQDRGNASFDPVGSGNHHTAGSSSGTSPSLATCIYGRPDVPGPLCNVMQGRSSDDPLNDPVYVVAAGRANHGGTGSWRGVSGNSKFYGLEVEHTGLGPADPDRLEVAARIQAALLEGASGDAAWLWQHFEYALPPGRKIDFFDLSPWTPDQFRARVAYWIGRTATTRPEEDDMTPEQEQKLDRILAQLDTNNKEGVAARLLASATRLENEHRRKLLNTLSDLSSKLDAYLAPWGTEWVDREGHKTTAGAPGAKLTTPAQRWWIETLRRLRGNWPPAPPPAG